MADMASSNLPSTKPSGLREKFAANIRPLLDAIDLMRAEGVPGSSGIELPTIAVIGDQGAGKSSLLSNLCGLPLPSGEGTVTRVPLEIRLVGSSSLWECTLEYQNAAGCNVKTTVNTAAEVAEAIDVATLAILGTDDGNGLKDSPIIMTIMAQGLPDLTLMDLPGLVSVATKDQPSDFPQKVRGMVRRHITPEETVILVVINAGNELQSTPALELASERDVDPDGQRTLAVITKVDALSSCTALKTKLLSDNLNIGLGFSLVINKRDDAISFEEARRREMRFLEGEGELKFLPELSGGKVRLGVAALADRLCKVQAEKISEFYYKGALKPGLEILLRTKERELHSLPSPLQEENWETARHDAWKDLSSWWDEIQSLIRGRYLSCPKEDDLHYAVRLHEKGMVYSEEVTKLWLNLLTDTYLEECDKVLKEAHGTTVPTRVPTSVLEQSTFVFITSLKDPSDILIGDMYRYGEKVMIRTLEKRFKNHPGLLKLLISKGKEVHSKAKCATEKWCTELFKHQQDLPVTLDSTYFKHLKGELGKALKEEPPSVANAAGGGGTDAGAASMAVAGIDISKVQLRASCNLLQGSPQLLLDVASYCLPVQKSLVDGVFKSIFSHMKDCLFREVFNEGSKAINTLKMQEVVDLLDVPEETKMKRQSLEDSIVKLCAAEKILSNAQTWGT